MIEKSQTTLVDVKRQEEEILLLLEQVLVALDQSKMDLPAVKVAEAIDIFRSR